MRRQAQLVTAGLVALVLAVVVALMATASTRDPGERATTGAQDSPGATEDSPGAAEDSPSAAEDSLGVAEDSLGVADAGSASPPRRASPRPPQPPELPDVRLPEPATGGGGDASEAGRGRAQQQLQQKRREAKQRAALVPAVPEIESGSLDCIEAIARQRMLITATFNIHGGFGRGGLNLDDIGREIARMNADVVLLQEVDRGRKRSGRRDQAALLGRRLGMAVAYDPNSGRRSGGTIGNAVLSRFPITGVRRAPLPRGGSEPRGVMRVVVDLDNVEVAVYVTHLEHTSAGVRNRQMRYIAGAVRKETLPYVLGGDLNATPGSTVLALARPALRDAWPTAGRGGARTVPRARIDYLMHGDSLRALRAQVVPSRISDHDAVIGAFEVGAPEACRQG